MNSPFSFGRTVRNEHFTNRESEVKRLASNFENSVNTIIISPRRWGKSSLVEKVAAQVRSKSTRIVMLDMFGIRSEEEFYNAFSNAVLKASASKTDELLDLARKVAKGITPRFKVQLGEHQSFDLTLDLETIRKHYRELLDLPEKIAREKNLRMIVCIDEFQNIGTFSQPLSVQKRLRSAWQLHERVTYCLYGSRQHMMLELFTEQSSPFYKFGEIMHLPPIALSKWQSYIVKQFSKTRKKITPEQATRVASLVRGLPYYVQQLSHIVWVTSGETVTDEVISDAVQDLVNQNGILYYRECEALNNTEIRLMKAILSGEKKLSSKEIIGAYGLGTSANVVKARRTLTQKEIIDREKDDLVVCDPVFEIWFRHNLMGQSLADITNR